MLPSPWQVIKAAQYAALAVFWLGTLWLLAAALADAYGLT